MNFMLGVEQPAHSVASSSNAFVDGELPPGPPVSALSPFCHQDASLDSFQMNASMPALDLTLEDFYRESDTVIRGLSLPFAPFPEQVPGSFDFSFEPEGFCGCRPESDLLKNGDCPKQDRIDFKDVQAEPQLQNAGLQLQYLRQQLEDAKLEAANAKERAAETAAANRKLEIQVAELREERRECTAARNAYYSQAESLKSQLGEAQQEVLQLRTAVASHQSSNALSSIRTVSDVLRLADAPMSLQDPLLAGACTSLPHSMRVCFMTSSPLLLGTSNVAKLQTRRELFAIESALQGSVPLEVKLATIVSLRRAMTEKGMWLHLSMHATKDRGGALLLEKHFSTQAALLWREELEKILACGCLQIEGVFISSCDSCWVAELFRGAGVRHIVCCSSAVKDTNAYRFAHYFYHALANHRSLREAFDIATQMASQNNDNAQYRLISDGNLWLSPQAMIRCSLEQVPVLSAVPRGLQVVVDDFQGRQQVIEAVFRLFERHRIVLLQSEVPSCGLTAALTAIADHIAAPGRMFERRCGFFAARDGTIPPAARQGLLIVDDVDQVLKGKCMQQLQHHLQLSGTTLLGGCHTSFTWCDYFGSTLKVACVPLPVLGNSELAKLFLLRCPRALRAGELMTSEVLAGRDPLEKLNGSEALEVLEEDMGVFAGKPESVCRAAERVNLVQPGSSSFKAVVFHGQQREHGSMP